MWSIYPKQKHFARCFSNSLSNLYIINKNAQEEVTVREWRKLLLARDTKQCENYTTNGHYSIWHRLGGVARIVRPSTPTRRAIHSFILSTRAINEFKLQNLLYAAKLLKSHTQRWKRKEKISQRSQKTRRGNVLKGATCDGRGGGGNPPPV